MTHCVCVSVCGIKAVKNTLRERFPVPKQNKKCKTKKPTMCKKKKKKVFGWLDSCSEGFRGIFLLPNIWNGLKGISWKASGTQFCVFFNCVRGGLHVSNIFFILPFRSLKSFPEENEHSHARVFLAHPPTFFSCFSGEESTNNTHTHTQKGGKNYFLEMADVWIIWL